MEISFGCGEMKTVDVRVEIEKQKVSVLGVKTSVELTFSSP